jgi:3-mercaptopyruvate sulfurtransferase SseA
MMPGSIYRISRSVRAPTIIEVRSPEEHAAGHLPGARNLPADEIPNRLVVVLGTLGTAQLDVMN